MSRGLRWRPAAACSRYGLVAFTRSAAPTAVSADVPQKRANGRGAIRSASAQRRIGEPGQASFDPTVAAGRAHTTICGGLQTNGFGVPIRETPLHHVEPSTPYAEQFARRNLGQLASSTLRTATTQDGALYVETIPTPGVLSALCGLTLALLVARPASATPNLGCSHQPLRSGADGGKPADRDRPVGDITSIWGRSNGTNYETQTAYRPAGGA
jgi:hypothetical protein